MNRFPYFARRAHRILTLQLRPAAAPGLLTAAFVLLANLAVLAQAPPPAQDQADEVLREMSQITGLPIKAPVKKKVLSREGIRIFLEETLAVEYPPEQIRKQEVTLKAFGLVSRDFNLQEFLLAFYTEQAAGVYDPRSKTMLIADWPAPDMQQLVLAHELTHALQDQNFDLTTFIHAERENNDASAARQAVMEGHATAAMMQRVLAGAPLAALPSLQSMLEGVIRQQFAEFPAFSRAPYFFRLEALFPYIHGLGFIQQALQARGGWENLGQVFQNPPTQTRQIFQPSLYLIDQAPERITLPRPPVLESAAGLRRVDENSLGQLGTMALLGQLISEEEAKALAPHALADRYIVYEDRARGSYALLSRSRWSGAEPALAFFRHAHTIVSKKYPELAPDSRSTTDLFIGSTRAGMVILLRQGNECRWAEGVPPNQTEVILKWLESM
jgi:hypothetical protein